MLIDARIIADGSIIGTGVCVVGAGPAGLALVQALSARGIASCLVEAGGADFSRASQDHYAGDAPDTGYDLMRTRTRRFGGSSHCWAGWCRPFSDQDLSTRAWIPDSGWPIGLDALTPYYPRAAAFLGLAPASYTASDWQPHAALHRAPLLDFRAEDGLETVISHLSAPVRFGAAYLGTMRADPLIRTFLHATVCQVDTTADCGRATGVTVQTGPDRRFRIEAKLVVLAAGGIENARLLLMSNQRRSTGLGNDHDVVGRYFMDHPRVRLGRVYLRAETLGRFYDVCWYHGHAGFRRGATLPAAAIGLTPAVQAAERLTQCHVGLIAAFMLEDGAAVDSGKALYRALTRDNGPALTPAQVLRGSAGAMIGSFGWASKRLRSRALIRHFQVQSVLEAAPDRDNRVMLGDGHDAYGLPRVCLRWRVGDLERRSHRAALDRLDTSLHRLGLGRVAVDPDSWSDSWHDRVQTTWHHMGTTRMHHDPRRGVVDTDCRVHGLDNLFIAGSSVFTTGGGNMPTLNLVALALRLADRLAVTLVGNPARTVDPGPAMIPDPALAAA